MAIEYKWMISSMNEYPKTEDNLTDVVFIVHYRRQAVEVDEDGKEWFADTYSTVNVPSPSTEDFTPYEQLTFEQVCGWLEGVLDVESIDESLARQIEQQKNPPIISLPLPWIQPTQQPEQPIDVVSVENNVSSEEITENTSEEEQPKESTWEDVSPAEESSSEGTA